MKFKKTIKNSIKAILKIVMQAGTLDEKTGFCIQAKDFRLIMLHWVFPEK